MIDLLESRRLFAAGVTITYNHGVMRIDGTSGADKIEFARLGKTQAAVYVDDVLTTAINLGKKVKSVTFYGGDGDDIFIMGRVPLPLTADGGDGNDILIGSPGDDTLLGGNGDDILNGESGNDVLNGGPGNNVLIP